jgi:hypothetical protein
VKRKWRAQCCGGIQEQGWTRDQTPTLPLRWGVKTAARDAIVQLRSLTAFLQI